jgi:hypothetical protein
VRLLITQFLLCFGVPTAEGENELLSTGCWVKDPAAANSQQQLFFSTLFCSLFFL